MHRRTAVFSVKRAFRIPQEPIRGQGCGDLNIERALSHLSFVPDENHLPCEVNLAMPEIFPASAARQFS